EHAYVGKRHRLERPHGMHGAWSRGLPHPPADRTHREVRHAVLVHVADLRERAAEAVAELRAVDAKQELARLARDRPHALATHRIAARDDQIAHAVAVEVADR